MDMWWCGRLDFRRVSKEKDLIKIWAVRSTKLQVMSRRVTVIPGDDVMAGYNIS